MRPRGENPSSAESMPQSVPDGVCLVWKESDTPCDWEPDGAGRYEKIDAEKKNYAWAKLLILIIILGGLSLWLYTSGLMAVFISKKKLLHFLDTLGPWSFAGFVVLQALQVVMAPIPGEVTGLLGGFLYGPMMGVILSTIGLTVGSYLAFALSRYFGRPFVERFVDKATLERFDYILHHKGAFLVFVLFLIPGVPKDYLCYILGLGHLTTLEFLIIGGTGRFLGTLLLTLAGNYVRRDQWGSFFILVGIAVIFGLLVMLFKDKLERRFRYWHAKGRRRKKKEDVSDTPT